MVFARLCMYLCHMFGAGWWDWHGWISSVCVITAAVPCARFELHSAHVLQAN
jgi:hypothetical protein